MKHNLKYTMLATLCLTPLMSSISHAEYNDDKTTVYTLSNTVQNKVLAYTLDYNGHKISHTYVTGGQGTGTGLGSQGALALSADGHYLFAVNAGSNEVSVFSVYNGKLTLLNHTAEPGLTPVSVTVSNDIVYVANSGDDSIFGFKFDRESESLQPLSTSYTKLADSNAGLAQISFNTDGDTLVVTEKNVNKITSFILDNNGLPTGATHSIVSSGLTPFGFAFGKHENIFVSEAHGITGGAPSTLSSYDLSQDGTLSVIDGAVNTTQKAACWVATTPNGRLAFSGNPASNSISSFLINQAGDLSLANATAATPKGANDLIVSQDGNTLYSLNTGENKIGVHTIEDSGNLQYLWSISIPAGTAGLVVSH